MGVVKQVVVAGLLIVVTLLVMALGWRDVMQCSVKRATAVTTASGVESLEKVSLGGVDQWLLIRVWDRANPVLLHLHGGPGSADISIARFFDTELIQHFTVVHWDQRGAEKSFSPYMPAERMTREQFVLDIRELAELLGKRFSVPKMNLFEQAPRIQVPVYFFSGRYDYNTPFELAERYYRVLDAPRGKHFIWFENAAHMIPYEAPDEYADALIHRVLKETRENEMRTAQRREPEPIRPQPGAAAAPTAEDLASATYRGIYAKPVTLRDGEWEGEPFAEGGASRPRVTLARDFRLTGDLDGDESHEAVVVLVESSGGSGTNQYLAAVGWRDLNAFPLATALVGDRVQIRSGRIANRRIELEVVQAGPEDAACCPSQNARRVWALEGEGLEEISTEITGSLSLADLEGVEWVLTHFGREEPAPIRPEVTLRVDGLRWSGSGGCNRYFTNVALGDSPGDVAAGPIGASRMACPPEQMEVEGRYLEALGRVSRFGFLTGRLFLTWSDDGAVQTLLFAPRSSEGGRQ